MSKDIYAKKGSRRWIQILINEKPEQLNREIRLALRKDDKYPIEWVSPLKSEKFREYNDQAFLKKLGINELRVKREDFWPDGGPVWDALGKGPGRDVFIVEAKSHIHELRSTCGAKTESKIKIEKSMAEVRDFIRAAKNAEWTSRFYQYGNRLAHLYWLKEKNGIPSYLINIYFYNDIAQKGPNEIAEWKGAIALLHTYFGIGKHKLSKNMLEIFIDVNKLK